MMADLTLSHEPVACEGVRVRDKSNLSRRKLLYVSDNTKSEEVIVLPCLGRRWPLIQKCGDTHLAKTVWSERVLFLVIGPSQFVYINYM